MSSKLREPAFCGGKLPLNIDCRFSSVRYDCNTLAILIFSYNIVKVLEYECLLFIRMNTHKYKRYKHVCDIFLFSDHIVWPYTVRRRRSKKFQISWCILPIKSYSLLRICTVLTNLKLGFHIIKLAITLSFHPCSIFNFVLFFS